MIFVQVNNNLAWPLHLKHKNKVLFSKYVQYRVENAPSSHIYVEFAILPPQSLIYSLLKLAKSTLMMKTCRIIHAQLLSFT